MNNNKSLDKFKELINKVIGKAIFYKNMGLINDYRKYDPAVFTDLGYEAEEFDKNKLLAKVMSKTLHKKRRNKMGFLIGLIPFGKTILIKGVMIAAKWVIRFVIKEKMTPGLLKYISVKKNVAGDFSIGVETSEFQRAAYATPRKWDNKVADLGICINKELYELKNI